MTCETACEMTESGLMNLARELFPGEYIELWQYGHGSMYSIYIGRFRTEEFKQQSDYNVSAEYLRSNQRMILAKIAQLDIEERERKLAAETAERERVATREAGRVKDNGLAIDRIAKAVEAARVILCDQWGVPADQNAAIDLARVILERTTGPL